MLDAQTVKKEAKACGADLVGIASIDRFRGAPPACDPLQILPEAQSVIVVGFRVFRGLLRGIEEGTLFANYSAMGYAGINQVQMPMMLWNFCRLFEDDGYEAIPFPNDFPWNAIHTGTGERKPNWSRPVAPGKPAPDVFLHLRLAAFAAGLGEIGWSKVFLTPQFGPRVRLGAVLTEAPLAADPLYDGPPLCDRCMACARSCTGGAISTTESVRVAIAGRTIEWGKLDVAKCTLAFQGGSADVAPDGEAPPVVDTRTGARPHAYNPFIASPGPRYEYGRAIEGGRGCIRACMMHLEQQGKLQNRFRNPFRRRPPWAVDWSAPAPDAGGTETPQEGRPT